MKEIQVKAPAKINTYLRVLSRREDGYHELEMVMVPLSLADDITLKEISSGVEFKLDGEGDAGMTGEKNLACRAAHLLKDEVKINCGVQITLKKNTPIAAGLGGGSSDAAAVLLGLNKLWDLGLSNERLSAMGSRLGADVPFFCHKKPAIVRGIGDRVEPIENYPNLSLLLVNPGFGVSTPWVYKQWDLQLTMKGPFATVCPFYEDLSEVISSLHNDLEEVTVPAYPEIASIKKVLLDAGALGSLMSGSGPTVFGVFENDIVRDGALNKIKRNDWRVIATDFKQS